MSPRDDLHALLDRLPEDILPAVGRYLAAVEAGMPPDIAEDDIPLSAEEEAALAASYAALARGETVPHELLGARIAERQERP
jgi:hypothetical protein